MDYNISDWDTGIDGKDGGNENESKPKKVEIVVIDNETNKRC